MDPASISLILTAGMRVWADFSERAAAGTLTQADIDKMLALLDHTLDTWEAKVKAHQAKP